MKAPRRQVIKVVKPSGNSGSIYVPREWIGRMVEISLFNVEAIVLEALYPYLANIQGIYLHGAHATGSAGPDECIRVLVVADRELPLDHLEGMEFTVIKADEIEKYAKENASEYSEMVGKAVAVMNQSLLDRLKGFLGLGEKAKDYFEGFEKAIAIAKSLAEEGDYESAAYALMQRIRDYSIIYLSLGSFSYEAMEGFAASKGMEKERFRRLYETYSAGVEERRPSHKVSAKDVEALFSMVDAIKDQRAESRSPAGEGEEQGSDDGQLTRQALLDRARKYREGLGGGAQ